MIIEVNNLVKRYKELIALDHFRLEVEEGEILGLLGPNGSGKTTAINCMLALLTYDKGDIRIFICWRTRFAVNWASISHSICRRVGCSCGGRSVMILIPRHGFPAHCGKKWYSCRESSSSVISRTNGRYGCLLRRQRRMSLKKRYGD